MNCQFCGTQMGFISEYLEYKPKAYSFTFGCVNHKCKFCVRLKKLYTDKAALIADLNTIVDKNGKQK